MGITGIIGQQGRGKSFYMCLLGIHHAMRFCKRVVTNFPLNIEFVEKFAIANNLRNLYKMVHQGDILFIPGDVEYLLSIPDSVVLFDEAAIFLGDATQSHKVSYLISRFNQCRKRGIELFYTGQAFSRIPKVLRDITTTVIYCHGICTRDEWGRPVLYQAKFTYFDPDEFDTWFGSSKRGGWFFTFRSSFRRHHFVLNSYYSLFFQIYDSFIDVVADAEAPGYSMLKIVPRGSGAAINFVESKPIIKSKFDLKKFFQPSPFLISVFKKFLFNRTYSTNDYIPSKKWDIMIRQRPIFNFDDPFKLRWLEKRSPVVVYQSFGQISQYPKQLSAAFVLTWRFAQILPAPLIDLLNLFNGFTFSVPSDSKFIKFVKMKF